MVPQETIEKARDAVEELRRRGELGQAEAIEAVLADNDELRGEVQNGQRSTARRAGDEIGDLVSATGQQVEQWVREGRYASYRIGNAARSVCDTVSPAPSPGSPPLLRIVTLEKPFRRGAGRGGTTPGPMSPPTRRGRRGRDARPRTWAT